MIRIKLIGEFLLSAREYLVWLKSPDQYVLSAPSGRRRPDSVPTGAHVARVRERASYWTKVKVEESWRATQMDP
ncbi:hypothetical protein E5676_scaffold1706G00480 [Cucumis melo var. makuwa]|uniref:Uncharacterized protein n=1 Tax=Cucumis melo var. makuwa TaxID=1194695 RepID=A0A5D3CY58_CUCMM|nr:hypothetical protein E5676_scaffold1706G00480 [Cucumis melo var. makuwa]